MNDDIKAYAKEKKVKLWQVADALGMTDSQFSRKLRYELDSEFKETIVNIIGKIASSKRSV